MYRTGCKVESIPESQEKPLGEVECKMPQGLYQCFRGRWHQNTNQRDREDHHISLWKGHSCQGLIFRFDLLFEFDFGMWFFQTFLLSGLLNVISRGVFPCSFHLSCLSVSYTKSLYSASISSDHLTLLTPKFRDHSLYISPSSYVCLINFVIITLHRNAFFLL